MSKLRDGMYVWATWLSRLMAGETTCQWGPWFKTHYTDYTRAPSDFHLATWTANHTQLLDSLVKERAEIGEVIYRENQNQFYARRSTGLVISGKPDLVTVDNAGHCKVYDAKTGNPKQSDTIQIMIYMLFLPYTLPQYAGKVLSGCIVYKAGSRSDIPSSGIDVSFQNSVSYFLDILESTDPLKWTPSLTECRYCDLTKIDCPDKMESSKQDLLESREPEVPI